MSRRTLPLLSLPLLAVAGVNAWCWSTLQSSRQSATDAERDVASCRQLADDIVRLRKRPAIAGSREMELTELSKRMEEAARAAQVPAGGLVRISPEAARRLDRAGGGSGYGGAADVPYLEKPTTVLLSGVTLPQLAAFMYAVGTGPSALDVPSLRLSAPRDEEAGDRWSAEVEFSYLIYAPPDEPNGGSPANVATSAGGLR